MPMQYFSLRMFVQEHKGPLMRKSKKNACGAEDASNRRYFIRRRLFCSEYLYSYLYSEISYIGFGPEKRHKSVFNRDVQIFRSGFAVDLAGDLVGDRIISGLVGVHISDQMDISAQVGAVAVFHGLDVLIEV